ncbi:pyridoxal-phosphate dependent enzyme [Actinoplanes sp. HUAS TT8]|uniref:pyridoxal-phosphate dependent enzyme n=1 Tax=Actinoplanes sp. HUAS TT8 TaxID=3447453 RepID=UPI003F5279C1
MLYQHISELIGGTPLLRLDPAGHGLDGVELYAKLESFNPFGSVKDRAAWAMIHDHLPGLADRDIVEASSGNTAKALQILATLHGGRVRAYTNRVKIDEVRDLLHLLGTDVRELPGLSECPDPTAPDDVFTTIERLLAAEPGRWLHPSQYTNERNVDAHYRGTGREIHDDLGHVDYLIGGLGTTGSTRGAASYLKEHNPDLRTVGVVSDRTGFIPGIRAETEMWEVGLFEPGFYSEIVTVDPDVAIDATLRLAGAYGVLAGPTSGATYAAALDVLGRRPAGGSPVTAVLIVCDRLEPYVPYLRQRRPDLFGRAARYRPGADELAAVPLLSPQELAGRADTLVVDTRGGMAYRIGHVPGALNIRDDQLESLLAQGSPFPAGVTVVFVCAAGERSTRLAALARHLGQDAAGLAGGITSWRDAGLPMESSARAR